MPLPFRSVPFKLDLPGQNQQSKNSRKRPPKAVVIKAIKKQVETRLESSLHNRIYLIPEQNLSQIEHPWNIDVKSGSQPKFRLPKDTHIIDVFDQSGVDGRLLILGKPGAGKTTMLLELAKVLIQRAEEDLSEPIPILLSLASWKDDRQSIADWIVAALSSGKYGKVRPDRVKQWLKDGEVIPLLDGLDELAASRQEICVKKLNEFVQSGNLCCPLVVCSRVEEYQSYSTELLLKTSIELQPLTTQQVQDYLRRTGNNRLWDGIRDNRELIELAQTPFLLNIMVISCEKISLDKWQKCDSIEEKNNYLLSVYTEVMLGREYNKKYPNNDKTKHWLNWLTRNLIKKNDAKFCPKDMEPNWLNNKKHKQLYRICVGLSAELIYVLIVGLIGGVIFGLNFGLFIRLNVELIRGLMEGIDIWLGEDSWLAGVLVGVSFGLLFGLILGLILGLDSSKIETPKTPNQERWKSLQNAVIGEMCFGLIVGLIVGLIIELIKGLVVGGIEGLSVIESIDIFFYPVAVLWNGSMSVGLIIGAIAGLTVGLIRGLESLAIETNTSQNQGRWKSLQNAVTEDLSFGLTVGAIGGLIIGIVVTPILGQFITLGLTPFIGLLVWLIIGLIIGLIVGLDSLETETKASSNQGIWKSLQNAAIGEMIGRFIVGLVVEPIQGLESSGVETKTSSNQGRWESLQNAVIIGLSFGLIVGLIGGLIIGLIEGSSFGLIKGLIGGLLIGLIVGLTVGLSVELMGLLIESLIACIQYLCLRLILYFNGYIPWNYHRFLDYAVERTFLQKVDGGYIFSNKMLMEYFAKIKLGTIPRKSN